MAIIATISGVLVGFILSEWREKIKIKQETKNLNKYADYLLTDTFRLIELTLMNIKDNSKNDNYKNFKNESFSNKRLLDYNVTALNDLDIHKLKEENLIYFSFSKRLIVNMISEIKEDIDKVKDGDKKSFITFDSSIDIMIRRANRLVNDRDTIIKELINSMYS
ncbi:hypothetical protein ACWOFO_05830 [Carnobacterium maltaromaticum]